jgi:quercetin dioxygenase-like cupin family protein
MVVALLLGAQQGKAPAHIIKTASDIQWGPASPALEKGAMAVVMSGDPGKAGPFVLRLKMPAGYRINPHWHPTDEHVTVVSGTFAAGMGDKFDAGAMKDLAAGSYAFLPAEMRHFALAKTDAVVQVHGMGPFTLTYVNAADDPRLRQSTK